MFDSASEAYDLGRPSYPSVLYDTVESLCGPLAGRRVMDGGAGTGIVSRELANRRALVVALDPGPRLLRRAIGRTPELRAVVGDAEAVPMRSGCVDLVTFGQSWHWVDQPRGTVEAARVLTAGGWWAAWWNQPWADTDAWFDEYYSLLETTCAGLSRDQRNVDWCAAAVAESERFQELTQSTFDWERRVTVEQWLVDLSSHSYVLALPAARRSGLLVGVESILRDAFANGIMVVPYWSFLWMARSAV
jgi:ubiquinone/menaquinone biosynthesis C-methylase UbiE